MCVCVSGKGETCGLGNKVHLLKSKGQSLCMRKQWIPGHFSLLPRGLGTRLCIVLNFRESNFFLQMPILKISLKLFHEFAARAHAACCVSKS